MKNLRSSLPLVVAMACALAFAVVAVTHASSIIRTDENVSYAGSAYPVGALIDASAAATTTTDVLEMRVLSGMSVQIDHGTITGSIELQSSNDNITFYPSAEVSFTAFSGSSGGEVVELANLRSRFYRFVYTHTSGTGLLKVTVHVKGKN